MLFHLCTGSGIGLVAAEEEDLAILYDLIGYWSLVIGDLIYRLFACQVVFLLVLLNAE